MENQKQNAEEIDLLELFSKLFQKISNALKAIFAGLLLFVRFSIKKYYIYLIFFVLGGVMSYVSYNMSKQYYSSEMVISTSAVNAHDMKLYIDDLHDMSRDENIRSLEKILEIRTEDQGKIKDIEAFYQVDLNKDGITDVTDYEGNLYNPRDTTMQRMKNRLVVRVQVFDNMILSLVRDGIYNYINSHPYVNQLNDIRQKELGDLIESIQEEIVKLDSLQKTEYFDKEKSQPQSSGQLMILNEQPTQLYHDQILSLKNDQHRYQRQLELYTDAMVVIKDFSPPRKAENNLFYYLRIYLIASLVLAALTVLVLLIRKRQG